MKTGSLDEFEQAQRYARIVPKCGGGSELQFPTKLNAKLNPLLGKDYGMDVVVEGETLRVILTRDKQKKKLIDA